MHRILDTVRVGTPKVMDLGPEGRRVIFESHHTGALEYEC